MWCGSVYAVKMNSYMMIIEVQLAIDVNEGSETMQISKAMRQGREIRT
jgi:hypothetical protein